MTFASPAEAAEFYESAVVPSLFAAWARRLIEAVAPTLGERLLDVACGTGAVARAATAGHVTGLDLDPAMLAVARRLRPDAGWCLGDAAALPFPDQAYDVVVSQAALMFLPDRVAALREMARVGGRLGLQVPGRLAGSAGYRVLADRVPGLFEPYFACGDPGELAALCERAGWRIDRFTTWTGATRMSSLESFLRVELLPLAGRADAATRRRITDDCRLAMAPFVAPDGSVAAPIEAHLVTGRPGR